MTDDSHDVELALIVGAARSGTTLLRSLLDAHPDIGCPAEAGLPGLMAHARRVWTTVCSSAEPAPADPLGLSPVDTPPTITELPKLIERHIERSTRAIMRYYCSREGKRIYCDKSLDSVYYLPVVYHTFPNAHCIIIVRHVLDAVASGLEASPFGFNAFGYTPYVAASPENTVMALARYWEAHITRALRWQADHPAQCHRVRYEDLVARPEDALAGVFDFLGVKNETSVRAAAFQKHNPLSGPGDYKLAFTTTITTASVGRGSRIPIRMIPTAYRDRLNELLGQCGYAALDESWNAMPKHGAPALADSRKRLEALMSTMRGGEWQFDVDSVAIIADDDTRLRWIIEPRSGNVRLGDGDVDFVLTGATDDLVTLLRGSENIGVLLRSGRVRRIYPESDRAWVDVPRVVAELVERFRVQRAAPADGDSLCT